MGKRLVTPVYRDENEAAWTKIMCLNPPAAVRPKPERGWTPLEDTTFINPILIWMGKLRTEWRELHAVRLRSCRFHRLCSPLYDATGPRTERPTANPNTSSQASWNSTCDKPIPPPRKHPFVFLSSNPTLHAFSIPAQEWPPVWNVFQVGSANNGRNLILYSPHFISEGSQNDKLRGQPCSHWCWP